MSCRPVRHEAVPARPPLTLRISQPIPGVLGCQPRSSPYSTRKPRPSRKTYVSLELAVPATAVQRCDRLRSNAS